MKRLVGRIENWWGRERSLFGPITLSGALPFLLALVAIGSVMVVARAGAVKPVRAIPAPIPTPTGAIAVSDPDGPMPPAIHATVRRGSLVVTLAVTPVDVGPAHFFATVSDHGRTVRDARVQIRLSMPVWPAFGTTILVATLCDGGYCSQGDLQALGRWHAEVLVQEHGSAAASSPVPFDIMNGANARFLFAQPPDTRFGASTVTIARTAGGSSILRILLRPALTVRAVVTMPNMPSMGTAVYAAEPLARGRYGVSFTFPMTGVTQLMLQVHMPGGWLTARTLLYDVDGTGHASLLTNTRS